MPVVAYSWLFVQYNEVVIDEIFGVVGCPWNLFHSSLNGVCCRWGGMFLFLPRQLGRCRWFNDSWPLLLPPASLLPAWSLPLFCWWSSVSFSVGGVLPSFSLVISSVRFLILQSWARFSSSYSFMRWMWDVRSRNKCCFFSFNITIILKYSSNNSESIAFLSFCLLAELTGTETNYNTHKIIILNTW